jgi:hypothetical protein
MHVHPNQLNPYAQLDAFHATQKAAAKREAARTRKKLLESASALAGESDSAQDAIAPLQPHQEPQENARQQEPQQGSRTEQIRSSQSGDEDSAISEWA